MFVVPPMLLAAVRSARRRALGWLATVILLVAGIRRPGESATERLAQQPCRHPTASRNPGVDGGYTRRQPFAAR